MEDIQHTNITQHNKGLYTDTSPQSQPKGTYRFALNTVNESELGDIGFKGNEESNEECAKLPINYIPIGKVYIGEGKTCVFLVSKDGLISEIGIYDDQCKYETHVNDNSSDIKNKLNFKVDKQIQATFRLRGGCNRTVYFTDDYNKPRYYDFDKPQDFKDKTGKWVNAKFNLQKTYSKIPEIENIEVFDTGGNLKPGSYNIAIQYIDASLNPTEWITSTNIIKIYNDSIKKPYKDINGSIQSEQEYLRFPNTSKAIKIIFFNLDENFSFYRLAFIAANSGTGLINEVLYSESIPISKKDFIYTGDNAIEKGTTEEILQYSDVLEKVSSIEQLENRLLLANTQGTQADLCSLQKYASKIKADCVLKKVILDNVTEEFSNPKNPLQNIESTGYMPGEIYSFGLVYIFEDNTLSPVYHIPGKSNNNGMIDRIFSYAENTFPMKLNNQSNSVYSDSNSCENKDYWGLDSEGNSLTGKKIRHHRFPLRNEIGKPLLVTTENDPSSATYHQLVLTITGTLKIPIGTEIGNYFEVKIDYKNGGVDYSFIREINANDFSKEPNTSVLITLKEYGISHTIDVFTDIKLSISKNNSFQNKENINLGDNSTDYDNDYFIDNANYNLASAIYTNEIQNKSYYTEILGIKFSGIELPTLEDTRGKKIIGYNIVRNERKDFDRTILDTGVLIPCTTNADFIAQGLLKPDGATLEPTIYGLIHPEHKFNNKEYTNYDKLIQQGYFDISKQYYGLFNYDDVMDGSSFNSEAHDDSNDDSSTSDGSVISKGLDGWSFNGITRDTSVDFKKLYDVDAFTLFKEDIDERFYLDALGSRKVKDNSKELFNIACDNKIGIITLKSNKVFPNGDKLPYVVLSKDNLDSYSNFRLLPYYKENKNPFYFDENNISEERVLFNGDSYITSMKYTNTVFWDNRVSERRGKKSFWKTVLGVALGILGGILLATGIGAALGALVIGAGITIIGGAALLISSGIKAENFQKAYQDSYEKGLRQTALDNWVKTLYQYQYHNNPYGFVCDIVSSNEENPLVYDGPSDDTIQWLGDSISDLWFESNVNMALRNKFIVNDTPSFCSSPSIPQNGNMNTISIDHIWSTDWTNSNQERPPQSELEKHLASKL
ncbi:MAG: hypothetical protein ACRC0V_11900, partial [Fusobacteriaceae bacterium]|uniref:hypothetical protein n=1 Tax=Romboutsia sp. TaxID=1965302 RepID=UPI003F40A379